MKRIIVLVALAALLAGCSNFTENTYRTLRIAEITHNALIDSADDAYARGIISYGKREQVEDADKVFQASFLAAKEALRAYVVAQEDEGLKLKVIDAIKSTTRDIDNLKKIYTLFTEGVEGVKEWKQ